MSSSVDNRIVEMEFDNEQFENGISTTMSTLEKFKDALKFDGATKGLEGIEDAVNNVNFNSIEENVTHLADRFSWLGEIAMTALQNITNRAVDAGIDLVKSLTVDNITEGMDKYERSLKATQTIMAATGKDVDDVQYYMDKLNWYTDETSYNYSDMAENIARFTSNGVDLDVATTAMFGIANASALAGADIQTAGHAMEGFAKALGQGYMDQRSWSWIKTAKMDTMATKQAFIDAAVEAGTLKKAADGAIYAENGEEVSAENFLAQLGKAKWLTNEVMINALGKFGSASEEIFKIYEEKGWTASEILAHIDELGLELDETSLKAFKAAQEYRTFSDAIDATKDAVSTGWMQTFRYIFGNYEEAKSLWTALGDTLYDIFAESGNARNELLSAWSDMGGRNAFIEALGNVGSALYYFDEETGRHMGVFGVIKDTFADMFPMITAERLFAITEGIRDFTKSLVPTEETLNKIQNIVTGILAPIRLLLTIGKGIIYALSPIFRIVGDLLGITLDLGSGIGAFSTNFFGLIEAFIEGSGIFQRVHDILNAIITVIEKVVGGIWNIITSTNVFSSIWSFVVNTFNQAKSFLQNLGLFKTISEGVGDFTKNIEAGADAFVKFIDESGLIQGFVKRIKDAWKSLKEFFGQLDVFGKLQTAWSTLVTWVTSAGTAISEFFQNSKFVQKLSEWWERLRKIFSKFDLGTILAGLLAPIGLVVYAIYKLGSAIVSLVQNSGILGKIWDVIKKGGEILYNFGSRVANFVSPYIDKIIDKFEKFSTRLKLFKGILENYGLGEALKYLFREPIAKLEELKQKVSDFIDEHPRLKALKEQFEGVGEKISEAWTKIKEADWVETISNAYDKAKEKVGGFIDKIQEFFATNPTIQAIKDQFAEWGDKISETWDKIKETDWVGKITEVYDTAKTKISEFKTKIQEFLETNPQIQAIKTKFEEFGQSIQDAWDKFKETDWVEVITGAFNTAKENVGGFIDQIKEFYDTNPTVQKIKDKFGEFGQTVSNAFDYLVSLQWVDSISTAYNNLRQKIDDAKSAVTKFFEENRTIQGIVDFFQPIIDKVTEFINTYGSLDGMHTLITTAISNIQAYANETIDFISEHGVVEWVEKTFSDIVGHLGELGNKLRDHVIPILDKVKEKLKEVVDKIREFISPKLTAFVDKIKDKFQDVTSPLDFFKKIFESVTGLFGGKKFTGLKAKMQPVIDFLSGAIEKIFGKLREFDVVGLLSKLAPILVALVALKSLSIFKDISSTVKAMKKESTSTTLIKIAGAIALVAGSLYILSTIKDMNKALTGLAGVVIAIGLLAAVAAALGSTKGLDKGVSSIAKSMIQMVIAVGLMILVVKLIERSDISFKTITDNFEKFAVIFGLMLALGIIARIAGKGTSGFVGMAAAILILLGVIKLLNYFTDDELKRGGIVVAALAAILGVFAILVGVASRIAGEGGIKGIGKTLIAMSVAIGILALCAFLLGKVDTEQLKKGVIAIGVLTLIMALFALAAGKAKGSGKTIIAMVVMIAAITAALYALSGIDGEQLLKSAGSIALIAGVLGVVMLLWGKLGVSWSSALAGAIGSAIVLAAITAAMIFMPKDAETNKANAFVLGGLAAVLGVVMIAWSKLGVSWSSALAGAIGSGILLGAITAAMVFMPKDAETNIANALVIAGLAIVLTGVLAAWEFIDISFDTVLNSVIACGAILAEITAAMVFMPKDAETNIENAKVIAGLAVVLTAVLAAWEFIDISLDTVLNSVIACGGILAEITLAMNYMPTDVETNIANARVIEELAVVLTAVLVAWEFVDVDLGTVLTAVTGIGGILAEIVIAMNYMPEDVEANIANARVIEELATVLSVVIGIFSKIGIEGALEGATAALVGIGEFLVGMEGIITALGGIATLVGDDLIDKGVEVIGKIGTAFGDLVGNFLEEVLNGLADGLTSLAETLTQFMEDITPFLNDLNNMDDSITNKMAILTGALLALMAADFLQSLTDFFSKDGEDSGLVKFGKRLQEFSGPFTEFVNAIIGCGSENSLNAAAAVADSVAAFADIKVGGLGELFTGSNNLEKFGSQLETFGPYFANFMNSLTTVNWTQANSAVTSFKEFVPLLSDIQNIKYEKKGWGQNSGFDQAMERIAQIPAKLQESLSGPDAQAALTSVTNFLTQISNLFSAENVSSSDKLAMSGFGKLICERIESGLNTYAYLVNNKVAWLCGAEAGIIFWFTTYLPVETFLTDIPKGIIIDNLVQGLNDNVGLVTEAAEAIAKAIIEGIEGVLTTDAMNNIGLNAAKGLAAGMTSKEATDALDAAGKHAGNTTANSARKALEERSPSRVFYQIGEFAMMGLANGITENTDRVMHAADESAQKTIDGFNYIAQMIGLAFEEGIDTNPVITPVLDLSSMQAGTQTMNTLLGSTKAAYVANRMSKSNTDLTASITQAVVDGLKVSQENNPNDLNGININVYGAQGQDVNALADAVAARIATVVQRRKAVYA